MSKTALNEALALGNRGKGITGNIHAALLKLTGMFLKYIEYIESRFGLNEVETFINMFLFFSSSGKLFETDKTHCQSIAQPINLWTEGPFTAVQCERTSRSIVFTLSIKSQ